MGLGFEVFVSGVFSGLEKLESNPAIKDVTDQARELSKDIVKQFIGQ